MMESPGGLDSPPLPMIISMHRFLLSIVAGLALANGLFAQAPAVPKIEFPAPSPAATIKQRVGLTDIEISYSRPSMKDRQIFGGLLPFGVVWRTGANTATKMTLSTAVKFNGAEVPAGTYEIFTIPGQAEWTFIIHKNMSQWGSYAYDPKNDVARVTAKPVVLAAPVETLAIGFNDLRDESATLNIAWENTRVPVKLEVDVTSILVPQIEAVMASSAAKKPYFSAAMFYLDHNLDLKKAAGWMDAAIAANPGAYYIVYRKGLLLEKMGDKEGALAAARQSMDGANKDQGALKDEYVHLNEMLISRLEGKAAPAPRPAAQANVRPSPPDTTSARIDGNRVTIIYGRPHSEDPKTGQVRKIWGGLVPYGKVWRTGANEATLLITQQAIEIGGVTLPGGGYTLYTLPAADGTAKLLINKKLGQWGADPYDESQEFARVDLTRETLPETVGQFTMAIDKNPAGGGFIRMRWENTQYSVPFALKK